MQPQRLTRLGPVLVALLAAYALASCRPAPAATPLPVLLTPDMRSTQTPLLDGGAYIAGLFERTLRKGDREGLQQRLAALKRGLADPGGDADRGLLVAAFAARDAQMAEGGRWQALGPAPIEGVYLPQGRTKGSGRVNGFAVDPRNSDVVYAAAAAGGLWKTTDAGRSWTSLSDRQPPAFYGGVYLDPRDPDTLYVALGVFDGVESATYGFVPNGILRSRDGGQTWQLLGTSAFNGAAVSALLFAADGTLLAASGQSGVFRGPPNQSDFGIFRSSDGGDTWTALVTCEQFASCVAPPEAGLSASQGGFMDLDQAADGTLYATLCEYACAGMHILRSRDDGRSWQELDFSSVLAAWEKQNGAAIVRLGDKPDSLPYLEGIELAVAPSDPQVLLAGGGLYMDKDGEPLPWSYAMRSTDGGDSWSLLPRAGDYCTGQGISAQCTYDNVVEIDPHNARIMYLGGSLFVEQHNDHWVKVLKRSTDGGNTWSDLTPGKSDATTMHPDAHALVFDPRDSRRLWVGTDGGVYRTDDVSARTVAWKTLSEGLDTLLLVHIALHPTDPDYLLAGLQDNANAFTTDGGRTWTGASAGDAGYVAVDPFRPNIVYSHYPPFYFTRNSAGGAGGWEAWGGPGAQGYADGLEPGDSWYFYPAFVLDPKNEGTIYIASNRVYKTEDRGDHWKVTSGYLTIHTIRTLAIAPSDPQVVYAGTSNGEAFVTRDGGATWREVTGKAFPPRTLERLAVDPRDADTAYAVFGGFDRQTLVTGHVFRTRDGGQTWDNVSYDLPDAPLTAVVVDAREKYAGVYVAGAAGVWRLAAGADVWHPYGTGMPNALISDLQLNPRTGLLVAATFGRSAWILPMP